MVDVPSAQIYLVPIITASGAIVGAILGTYFTGKHSLDLEDKRIKEQQKRQDEISHRVMRLVAVELAWLIGAYKNIQEQVKPGGNILYMKTLLELDQQYPRLPIETKISAFNPDLLTKIEHAYRAVGNNIEIFNSLYTEYEEIKHEIKHNELEKHEPEKAKKMLEEAEVELTKVLSPEKILLVLGEAKDELIKEIDKHVFADPVH